MFSERSFIADFFITLHMADRQTRMLCWRWSQAAVWKILLLVQPEKFSKYSLFPWSHCKLESYWKLELIVNWFDQLSNQSCVWDCGRLRPVPNPLQERGHRTQSSQMEDMGAESCAAEEVGIRSGAAAAHPEPQSLGAWGGDLWGLCILYDVAFHNCPYPQGNGGERGTESANFSCNPPLIKKHRYASDVWSYNFTHRFLLIRKDHFTQKTSLQWCYYPCSPPYPPAISRTPLGLPEISTVIE